EILLLLAPLPLWIGLGWLCWRLLERQETLLDIDDASWQVMVLAWGLGLVFLSSVAFLRFITLTQMRPEEATLFLQDTFWRETSREQRRLGRWVSWARIRKRKVQP